MENVIIDKLRKLILHEKSARGIGNIHEAEAFASKIQELLTSHKLGMSDVDFEERDKSEPIEYESVRARDLHCRNKKHRTYWRVVLGTTIAQVNSCRLVGDHDNSVCYFVGRTSDRELAKMVYIYLVELCEDLCVKNAVAEKYNQEDKFNELTDYSGSTTQFQVWMKKYKESWKIGFGKAIVSRLEEMHADMLSNSESSALVHIKKDAVAVDDYLKGKTSKTNMSGKSRSGDGFEAGYAAGASANLSPHRFTGATGRTSRLLGS